MDPETPVRDEIEALLRRGLDFYGKDFYAEAERCWRRVLLLAPREQRAIDYLEAMGVDPSTPPPEPDDDPPTVPPARPSLWDPEPPSTRRLITPALPPSGLRLLVADGSSNQIRLVAALLGRTAEVMGATSLDAARSAAASFRPQMALIAFLLPGGDGARAVEALRLLCPAARFVLTAAPAEAPLVRPRLGALGAQLYLKPFARDPLLRLLSGLDAPRPEPLRR